MEVDSRRLQRKNGVEEENSGCTGIGKVEICGGTGIVKAVKANLAEVSENCQGNVFLYNHSDVWL